MEIEHQLLFLRYILALGALVALLMAGWNAWMHLKFKTQNDKVEALKANISKLWSWKDGHVDKYNKDRLNDAKSYATRNDLREAEKGIVRDMKEMEARIENRLDKMDHKLDRLLGGK